MTTRLEVIADGRLSVNTVPPTLQPLAIIGAPSTYTVNNEAGGREPPRFSVIVSVSDVPPVFNTALRTTGGPVVDKLIATTSEKDSASLPDGSCTAKFVVAVFGAGGAYDTLTICVDDTTLGKVSVTVEPDTDRAVGVTATPSTIT